MVWERGTPTEDKEVETRGLGCGLRRVDGPGKALLGEEPGKPADRDNRGWEQNECWLGLPEEERPVNGYIVAELGPIALLCTAGCPQQPPTQYPVNPDWQRPFWAAQGSDVSRARRRRFGGARSDPLICPAALPVALVERPCSLSSLATSSAPRRRHLPHVCCTAAALLLHKALDIALGTPR